MASTGTTLPTTTPDPGTADNWTNGSFGIASDGSFATYTVPFSSSSTERRQDYGGFGFSIPAGAHIDGVTVNVRGKVSTGTGELTVQLRRTTGSTGNTTNPTFSTSNSTQQVGASDDLWGLTDLTAADLNDDDVFYVSVSTEDINGVTFYLDHINVNVQYTNQNPPTVTTQSVTNITSTTATGRGNVTDDGNDTITERGVCWNTTGTPTTADSTSDTSGTTGSYTVPMTGLVDSTLYYVRAYAINGQGTSYGSQKSFTASGFTNPSNAFSSNDSYTTVSATSGDISIQLSGDAAATYSSVITKTFTSTEASQTYGNGSTELWGMTWLGSNVSDANFRLKVTVGGSSQTYKTFGFAPAAGVVLTGIEVSVEAKWDGSITSIDHIKVKIYYGTSTTPVQAGSLAFITDGGAGGTGAIGVYNGSSWITTGSGNATTSGTLAQFAATTSLELKGVITNETGSGALVFATSPTLVTPALGTPSSGVMTNMTGLTNAGLSTTAGEPGSAWQDWTPTFGNLSGGTLNYAKYLKIGKNVWFRWKYTLGGAGVGGSVSFSLPVAASSGYGTDVFTSLATYHDVTDSVDRVGAVDLFDADTGALRASKADGTYLTFASLSSSVPFTWAINDIITVSGIYEAA